MNIKKLLDSYTATEVGDYLGLLGNTVVKLVRHGKLAATKVPNGLRIDADTLQKYMQKRESTATIIRETWQAQKVRDVFGISPNTLDKWCATGLLSFEKIGSSRQFEPQSVLALKAQLEQVNAGFEWLSNTKETYTAQHVTRVLGVAETTVNRWAEKGFLPFKRFAPDSPRTKHRAYIANYITALVTYAPALPVSKEAALEFKQKCAEASMIVTDARSQTT